jgi:hypothetical protein
MIFILHDKKSSYDTLLFVLQKKTVFDVSKQGSVFKTKTDLSRERDCAAVTRYGILSTSKLPTVKNVEINIVDIAMDVDITN